MNNRYVRGSKKNGMGPLVPIAVIALGIIVAAGFLIYSFFSGNGEEEVAIETPNMEEISFFDYIGNMHLRAHGINVIIGGEISSFPNLPVFIGGELYLPADFLREYVDRYIFWEENTGRLTITNADEVMRFTPNSDIYTVNWEERTMDFIIRELAGMAYMPADMIMQRYPLNIEYHEEYSFVVIDFHRNAQTIFEIVMNFDEEDEELNNGQYESDEDVNWVPMRFGANDQFPIMARLTGGQRVLYFGHDGDFVRIRTENGLIGYVDAGNVEFVQTSAGIPEATALRPITRPFDGPINLIWHFMNMHNPETWYVPHGLNVISPVWFTFDEELLNGDIISHANHNYISWAHANGLQVWPALQDANSNNAFRTAISRAVLTDANIRDHVIAQIMHFVEYFNLDGIQMNFEVVRADFAEEYIQFLRELAVPMRQAGAILSATTTPPIPDTMFWNREEIGLTVDYAIIMAYDEHWSTSPIAGPVASYNFILDAVRDTLNEIPAERIVVALPTYVRIWTEEFDISLGEWRLVGDNAGGQASRAVGMNHARNFIESNGGEFYWDYILRQYYGEVLFEEDGIEMRHRVWLDDLRSMNERLGIVGQYDLAGVGFWQKGLELPGLWDLVYSRLNPR